MMNNRRSRSKSPSRLSNRSQSPNRLKQHHEQQHQHQSKSKQFSTHIQSIPLSSSQSLSNTSYIPSLPSQTPHLQQKLIPTPTLQQQQYLFRVPRLSIAPMVDVTDVFFRLFNRIISHNTTLYTEMIVDKQLLNALPFSRVSIGIMHPSESNNFIYNMQRFYQQQQLKKDRHLSTMLSLPSNQIPNTFITTPSSSTTLSSSTSTSPTPSQSTPTSIQSSQSSSTTTTQSIQPSINPLIPIQLGSGTIAQISGADAFELAATSVLLQSMGYDGININMGCPASSAQSGLHGALMMITPYVETQLERLRSNPAIYIPISIKCRIGVNKVANYNWFKDWICAYITQTGICHYIVHSRIAKLNFNPRKNLNIPPLHPQYIHYLQNDIRQYIQSEKDKLYKIMNEYYEQEQLQSQSTQQSSSPSQLQSNEQQPIKEKPFGITGVNKNACMYYIDPTTQKKCYVPLSICLEYNGGAVNTSQIAELCWALNENGGYVLRSKSKLDDENVDIENDNDDDINNNEHNPDINQDDVQQQQPEQQLNEDKKQQQQSKSTTQINYDNNTTTKLHIPAESISSPNNTEPISNPQDDFHWMRKEYRSKPTTLTNQNDDNNSTISISTPTSQQNNNTILKQPLLPGIMVGRGDMNDVLFPIFYDAFQHALVLASNGKLDAIPHLINNQYNDTIDTLHYNNHDDYNHVPRINSTSTTTTTESITTQDYLLQQQSQPLTSSSSTTTTTTPIDPDRTLYQTLTQHMNIDPIQHHSGLYIDIRTGQWVNNPNQLDQSNDELTTTTTTTTTTVTTNTNSAIASESTTTESPSSPTTSTHPIKNLHQLSEIDKINSITSFPSTLYPLSSNPSRLDILFHYLNEVDQLLFNPNYAGNLQLQYELLTTNNNNNKNNNNSNTDFTQHQQQPTQILQLITSSTTTTSQPQSTTSTPSSHTPISFLDSTTSSITPLETIELNQKYKLTQFDQQSLTTCVSNPLNRQSSLSHQPYPYDLSQSSCSFATTVSPQEQYFKTTANNHNNNNNNHNNNGTTTNNPNQEQQQSFHNNNINQQSQQEQLLSLQSYQLTPHPFVEGIVRVLLSQELSDICLLFDSIQYLYKKLQFELSLPDQTIGLTLKQMKTLDKPTFVYNTYDDLYKALISYEKHPFLHKVKIRHYQKQLKVLKEQQQQQQQLSTQQHIPIIDINEDLIDDPQWMKEMQDYTTLIKYRTFITQFRTHFIQSLPTDNNNNNTNQQQQQQFSSSSTHDLTTTIPITKLLSPSQITILQQLYTTIPLEYLHHNDITSSDARSRVSTSVNRLTRISETQSITSTFYGYLYSVSDLFLRPLYSLFANTEGNEQWRKIIHTACLLTRGTTDEIFSESYFWTHDNKYNGNIDPKFVQALPKVAQSLNGGGRVKMVLQHIEKTDVDKKWAIHSTFPYIGTSNERNPLDKCDFSKSNVHTLLQQYNNNDNNNNNGNENEQSKQLETIAQMVNMSLTSQSTTTTTTSSIMNDNNNNTSQPILIQQNYNIDTLAYDPRTMKLYPTALLSQYTTPEYESKQTSYKLYQTQSTSKRITGIIDSHHPITTINDNELTQQYYNYLLQKSHSYFKQINNYAQIYIQYNQQSFDTYLQNKDGYLNAAIQYQLERDQDTMNYIHTRIAEMKQQEQQQQQQLNEQQQLSNEQNGKEINNTNNTIKNNNEDESIQIARLVGLKGGGGNYKHFNITPEYIQKRRELTLYSPFLRRVHISFFQRFPFDLTYIQPKILQPMISLVGGDYTLYQQSPFLQIGYDNILQRYRTPNDIEFQSFQSRHQLESVSWLHSICQYGQQQQQLQQQQQNTTSIMNDNTENLNSTTTSSQQQQQSSSSSSSQSTPSTTTTSTSTTNNNNSTTNNNNNNKISQYLHHTDESLDIYDAIPTFALLCERYMILQEHHSYQYLLKTKINTHNALIYIRDQLSIIDSIPIPQDIIDYLEPLDLHELRRSTYPFSLTRTLLRQPILDFTTKYKLYTDAKNAIAQMNGIEMSTLHPLNPTDTKV